MTTAGYSDLILSHTHIQRRTLIIVLHQSNDHGHNILSITNIQTNKIILFELDVFFDEETLICFWKYLKFFF